MKRKKDQDDQLFYKMNKYEHKVSYRKKRFKVSRHKNQNKRRWSL